MNAYKLSVDGGVDGIAWTELPDPEPGPGMIVVGVHSTSLNYRYLESQAHFGKVVLRVGD